MSEAKNEQKSWYEAIKPLKSTFANGGTHVNVSAAAIAKNAPNKDSAVKLIEYMLGEKAQTLYADGNFEFPVNADVKESAAVKLLAHITRTPPRSVTSPRTARPRRISLTRSASTIEHRRFPFRTPTVATRVAAVDVSGLRRAAGRRPRSAACPGRSPTRPSRRRRRRSGRIWRRMSCRRRWPIPVAAARRRVCSAPDRCRHGLAGDAVRVSRPAPARMASGAAAGAPDLHHRLCLCRNARLSGSVPERAARADRLAIAARLLVSRSAQPAGRDRDHGPGALPLRLSERPSPVRSAGRGHRGIGAYARRSAGGPAVLARRTAMARPALAAGSPAGAARDAQRHRGERVSRRSLADALDLHHLDQSQLAGRRGPDRLRHAAARRAADGGRGASARPAALRPAGAPAARRRSPAARRLARRCGHGCLRPCPFCLAPFCHRLPRIGGVAAWSLAAI